jgi:hypothetical protein
MNVWEKNSKRLRRQAELKRVDEWLKELHAQRPIVFLFLTAAISVAMGMIFFGILTLLERISER